MQEEKIKSRGSLSWPPHKLNYGETDGGARFKAASHDSRDGYLQPPNDEVNIQHQLVRSALLKTAHVAFLPAKTVASAQVSQDTVS